MQPIATILALLALWDVAESVTSPEDFYGPTDITLYLYTQKNPEVAEYITLGNDSTSPSFNPKNPTRFFTHGWISNALEHLNFRDGYLGTGEDYNVVLLDWGGIAALNAFVARDITYVAGDYVAQLISQLQGRGLQLDDLRLVGHSMGAHFSGIIGNRIGGAAQEIVGLDPAWSLYDDSALENQLDPTDGRFVQVIHTNGGGLGVPDARGDADFFVNGGRFQAGCGTPHEGIDGCSHNIILDFYVESISSDKFVASRCGSYDLYLEGGCSDNEHVPMGEGAPSVNGTYYLNTNSESPYAQGQTDL